MWHTYMYLHTCFEILHSETVWIKMSTRIFFLNGWISNVFNNSRYIFWYPKKSESRHIVQTALKFCTSKLCAQTFGPEYFLSGWISETDLKVKIWCRLLYKIQHQKFLNNHFDQNIFCTAECRMPWIIHLSFFGYPKKNLKVEISCRLLSNFSTPKFYEQTCWSEYFRNGWT